MLNRRLPLAKNARHKNTSQDQGHPALELGRGARWLMGLPLSTVNKWLI